MKVIAINGSPRKGGNTEHLIKEVFRELEAEGIETELIQTAGKKLRGCIACMKCHENQDGECAIKNDDLNGIMAKMNDADGIILGSPTYFANVSTEMKAIIDRAGMTSLANGSSLRRKVGAGVVAVRRGGAMQVFNALNTFFTINQVMVVGSSYWNIGRGLQPGDVMDDAEGLNTMENLGKNMAWLLKKIHA